MVSLYVIHIKDRKAGKLFHFFLYSEVFCSEVSGDE